MEISYEIIRSSRRTLSIEITARGKVLVRCPKRLSEARIRKFVEKRESWILEHLHKLPPETPAFTPEELARMTKEAKAYFPEKTAEFAQILGVSYGSITIRHQKTRWGSCSSCGNLNFNCLLMLAPDSVREYVVAHELCHRKQMNHSPAFWAEVEKVLPDYRLCRRWLKENGRALIGRLQENG